MAPAGMDLSGGGLGGGHSGLSTLDSMPGGGEWRASGHGLQMWLGSFVFWTFGVYHVLIAKGLRRKDSG